MINNRSIKSSAANSPLVSPNAIVKPGSFSGARSSTDITGNRAVSSFQLRNQMFDQNLKNELVNSTLTRRSKVVENVVAAPKQGLTLNALKKHNQGSSRKSIVRRDSEAPLTHRSSRSDGSTIKKSPFELEVVLVEKQLHLKRILAEHEKKKKLYVTVARQLQTKKVENAKTEKFISESLEKARKNLTAIKLTSSSDS